MAGEYIEEQTNSPDEFFSQPWYRRILIALAGPAMNYVLAFVLFAGVALVWGVLQPTKQAIIGGIVAGLPADMAKLIPGDKILSIDGQAIGSWEEMAKLIHARPEQKLKLEIERSDALTGATHVVQTTLVPKKDLAQGIGLIGVMPYMDKVQLGIWGSIKAGAKDVKVWTLQPLNYISMKIKSREGPKELSGPLGIAQMMTQATKEGISYVIYLIAIISTGLGLFNLFPIPILDGGHILLYTIEGIRRRPLSAKAMQYVNMAGLAVVATIFIYASYQDVLRLRIGFWK
jgi:regulator of sigma E protease